MIWEFRRNIKSAAHFESTRPIPSHPIPTYSIDVLDVLQIDNLYGNEDDATPGK